MKKKGRWYHNGSDTFDGPEIVFVPGDEELKWQIHGSRFSEGPFNTFSEAKKDMLDHYRRWVNTARDAVYLAKKLRKPKGRP